jgi:hypothetical protein
VVINIVFTGMSQFEAFLTWVDLLSFDSPIPDDDLNRPSQ